MNCTLPSQSDGISSIANAAVVRLEALHQVVAVACRARSEIEHSAILTLDLHLRAVLAAEHRVDDEPAALLVPIHPPAHAIVGLTDVHNRHAPVVIRVQLLQPRPLIRIHHRLLRSTTIRSTPSSITSRGADVSLPSTAMYEHANPSSMSFS